MKFSDIRWFYFRLRAMSTGEVFHRFREQAKRTYDSHRAFHFDSSTIALPIIPGLLERVRACSDIARSQFRAVADEIRGGRYHFLGQDWPKMDGLPDWHLDPISGKRWRDDVFCYSVPFRHNRDYGDVKYVWELNRLQYLQFVAAAAACDDDPDLAKLCVSQIRSWIDANPPFKGLNWSSGIELALRIVSFIVVFSLLPQSSFSEEDRSAISASLRAHLFWLKRYPSRYSSANNHLIAEAAGLFLLGLLLPELPGSRRIAKYGRSVLNAQALIQILEDGVPAEQSPTYGAFTAEWLLLAESVARAEGHSALDATTVTRLAKFEQFLRSITDCDGNLPRIGDDDEGHVVAGVGDTKDYLNSITAILGQWPARTNHDSNSDGNVLRKIIFNISKTPLQESPLQGVIEFPVGGYTVVRERENNTESLLILDHGPLGFLSIAAHGHADALSVWLHINGREILIDAGTYLYHSGAKWREHFRGTAAHNTLLVNGADQSIQSGDFNWSAKAVATRLNCTPHLDTFRWDAVHDGYLRRFGLRHRRCITRQAAGSYRIEDFLIGDMSFRSAEVGYLLADGLNAVAVMDGWLIQDNAGRSFLKIECSGDGGRNVQRGLQFPEYRGWMSPRFGTRRPTSRLAIRFSDNSRKLTTLLTCIYDETENKDEFNLAELTATSNSVTPA